MKSFRYELRSPGHLEELASSRLPDGIPATDAHPSQHRDVYLDTEDDTLRRREIVCRFRLGADDSRLLSLRIGSGDDDSEVRVDSPVQSPEPAAAALENTEAGRRLRALVNPELLAQRLDLEGSASPGTPTLNCWGRPGAGP